MGPKTAAAAALVVALLVGSCTDRRETASGPCDLLMVEEIRAEVGNDATQGRVKNPIDAPPKTMCVYGLGSKFGSLEVFLDRSGESAFSRRFEQDHVKTISIKGLGDDAYTQGSSVAVRVGRVYLSLGTQYDHPSAPRFLRNLAAIAVTRI